MLGKNSEFGIRDSELKQLKWVDLGFAGNKFNPANKLKIVGVGIGIGVGFVRIRLESDTNAENGWHIAIVEGF